MVKDDGGVESITGFAKESPGPGRGAASEEKKSLGGSREAERMQMKTGVEPIHWIIAPLVLIALGVAVIVYVALSLPGAKLGGGFFLAIGALNVLFYKSTGSKFFAKTQSSRPFVARFWARSGENGTQLLFLGIGVILAVAGGILLVAGTA